MLAYGIDTGELDTGPAVLLWGTRYNSQVGTKGCYGAIRVSCHSCRPIIAAPPSPSPQVVLHMMITQMPCKPNTVIAASPGPERMAVFQAGAW